jgi:hypothetical protein
MRALHRTSAVTTAAAAAAAAAAEAGLMIVRGRCIFTPPPAPAPFGLIPLLLLYW